MTRGFPDQFAASVRSTIADHRLLRGGRRVVVACSGGPDSTALVHVLHALAPELGLELAVATVDHGLRDASREHEHVEALARALALPWRLLSVHVVRAGRGMQDAARRVRLAALQAYAVEWGARAVALGHTRTDQAETVLLRLMRGAGSRGLGGMSYVRGGFVRPMLDVGKQDVLAYLESIQATWVDDPTNDAALYLRNRVRHTVWPMLEDLAPAFEEKAASAAAILRADAAALASVAERSLNGATRASGGGWLELDLAALGQEPMGLWPHVVRQVVRRMDAPELERRHLDACVALLRGTAGTKEASFPGLVVERRYGRAIFRALTSSAFGGKQKAVKGCPGLADEAGEPCTAASTREVSGLLRDGAAPDDAHLRVWGPGCYRWGRSLVVVDRLRFEVPPMDGVRMSRDTLWLDEGGVRFPLDVRPGRVGERIALLHTDGSRKLSDVLIDAKVPRCDRAGVAVVEEVERGRILWLAGVRRSRWYPIGEETRCALRIRVVPN